MWADHLRQPAQPTHQWLPLNDGFIHFADICGNCAIGPNRPNLKDQRASVDGWNVLYSDVPVPDSDRQESTQTGSSSNGKFGCERGFLDVRFVLKADVPICHLFGRKLRKAKPNVCRTWGGSVWGFGCSKWKNSKRFFGPNYRTAELRLG